MTTETAIVLVPNWGIIQAEYLAGGVSCRELAERYGVPQSTLSKRCHREGWKAEREKVSNAAASKTADLLAEDIAGRRITSIDVLDDVISSLWTEFRAVVETGLERMPDEKVIELLLKATAMRSRIEQQHGTSVGYEPTATAEDGSNDEEED